MSTVATEPAPPQASLVDWPRVQGLPAVRYGMLLAAVVAQAVTILLTWPLWQVREAPVHLPLFDLPQVPFGWWMLGTLGLVLFRPRLGLLVHAAALLVSFAFDQYRTQPQFIALVALMLAAVEDVGVVIVRWFLASLWTWAGLHKLLSPDWFSFASWNMASALVADPTSFQPLFAWGVGLGELSAGMLAVFRPRWAVVPCVMMHVGIVLFLSPLFYNWNCSVMPWNLATALVGGWVMGTAPSIAPRFRWEWLLAGLFLVYPAGFYLGWVDHGIASVLYSSHIPRGLVTTTGGTEKVSGWGDLRVPFPNERRLLRIYFEQSAPVGAKLHIADPRGMLDDLYYVKQANGRAEAITRAEFLAASGDEVAGVELDSRRIVFLLSRAGAILLQRQTGSAIYAVRIEPHAYRPDLLDLLAGLPNLEQLDLEGCPVTDADLLRVPYLPKLAGIGLAKTKVTPAGLKQLDRQPELIYIDAPDAGR